jgi:FtsP/CotA-like multicopper oxidase with cupredoxin domain
MKKYIHLLILAFAFGNFNQAVAQTTFNWFARMVGTQPLWDGQSVNVWGFVQDSGSFATLPGPTMIVNEGDAVTLNITNQSPAPHTVHLHGLDVDQLNDGVPQTSFEIPGMLGTGSYTFTAPHPGTYIYHCHVETVIHLQMGMYGAIIVKPAGGSNTVWAGGPAYDLEYLWVTSEIDKSWHDNPPLNGAVPAYEPDYFLVNGKSDQQLTATDAAISAGAGQQIFLRLANTGYGIHEFVFPPELNAALLSSDGRPLPQAVLSDTVAVYPGERYGVMLNSTDTFTGNVLVHYFDMYDQDVLYTNAVPVEITGTTGVQLTVQDFEIRIFPNPAQEMIQVTFKNADSAEKALSLFDAGGNLVWSATDISDEWQIQTGGLPAGAYFLQITTPAGTRSERVIIE